MSGLTRDSQVSAFLQKQRTIKDTHIVRYQTRKALLPVKTQEMQEAGDLDGQSEDMKAVLHDQCHWLYSSPGDTALSVSVFPERFN